MATYPIRQLADNGGTAQFVPVTAPEAVQFPDGSNLNTLIGSIATIESNPVAANHAVGEFLCINGQVYEVIDAITAGDSIALGENVQVTNLGSQITALNNGLNIKSGTQAFSNVAITTSYGGGSVYYGNITFTGSVFDSMTEILAVTLIDYGGLGGVIMPQITGAKSLRLWSDKSQTPTSLTFKLLFR